MTRAVIVQARMGSTRFPGKVLEDLGGEPVLKRCLARLEKMRMKDLVIVAVPDTNENDILAEEVTDWGYQVSRGSEDDVLSRYAKAARQADATTVMRVTSDCPMIDPAVCDDVMRLFQRPGVGYACNNMPARFPHGLDCEVFSAEDLYAADAEAETKYCREHVSPWIRSNETIRKASLQGPGEPFTALRWTLDHREDLDFMRALYGVMGDVAPTASAQEYARVCMMRPNIVAINAEHHDEGRLAFSERAHIETSPNLMNWAA